MNQIEKRILQVPEMMADTLMESVPDFRNNTQETHCLRDAQQILHPELRRLRKFTTALSSIPEARTALTFACVREIAGHVSRRGATRRQMESTYVTPKRVGELALFLSRFQKTVFNLPDCFRTMFFSNFKESLNLFVRTFQHKLNRFIRHMDYFYVTAGHLNGRAFRQLCRQAIKRVWRQLDAGLHAASYLPWQGSKKKQITDKVSGGCLFDLCSSGKGLPVQLRAEV
jgi:hypothetical protein